VVPSLAYFAYRRPHRSFRNHVLEWAESRYQACYAGASIV